MKLKHLVVAMGLFSIAGGAAATNLFADETAKSLSTQRLTAKEQRLLQHWAGEETVQILHTTTLKAAALNENTRELTLNLMPGTSYRTAATKVERSEDGSLIWYGTMDVTADLAKAAPDESRGEAILVLHDGMLSGTVRTPDGWFQIEPLSRGRQMVLKRSADRMPPDHPAEYAELLKKAIDHEAHDADAKAHVHGDVQAKANTVIKVLVAYTPAVLAKHADITGFINLAMAETNKGYVNSGIAITAQLATALKVNYTETGSVSADKNNFLNMSAVKTARNTYAADLNVLLVTSNDACGIAAAIGATEANAYAVVSDGCATGYYSFAHEMGHLQSARHNPETDPTNTPYTYGHGYRAPNSKWRTVMAYNCSPSCPRINYWSNPSVRYSDGQYMGTTTRSNNARVLNTTAAKVAAFR